MKAHGGGFSREAHFKKWYKKVYLTILDGMLLNALIVWNDSAEELQLVRPVFQRNDFYLYFSQVMSEMKNLDQSILPRKLRPSSLDSAPCHVPVIPKNLQVKCTVCKLENGQGLGGKALGEKGLTQNVATCSECHVSAHAVVPEVKRKIHGLNVFKSITCFEIIHTRHGCCLWEHRDPTGNARGIAPQPSNEIYKELRQMYDRPSKIEKKRRSEALDGSNYS